MIKSQKSENSKDKIVYEEMLRMQKLIREHQQLLEAIGRL